MRSDVCSVQWVVGSNIVIGLYVLDMWSVLCVPYVDMVGYNIVIATGRTGHVVSVVYSICDRTVRTGHVVSVICCVCGRYVLI